MSHATRPTTPRPQPARRSAALALAVAACCAGTAAAQSPGTPPPTLEDLARRLQALEAKQGIAAGDAATLAELDRRLRLLEARDAGTAIATTAAPASAAPGAVSAVAPASATASATTATTSTAATSKPATSVAVSPDSGLSVKSGDAEFRLRALIQADGRFWTGDDALPQNDGFLMRLVRPTFEGSYGKFIAWRITPELAGDSATLVDAYVDLKFDPRATVRLGRMTGPVGLERSQASNALVQVERSFPTELVPNRDIGVQLQGAFAGGKVDYAAGVYNGTVDGRDASTTNPDDELEFGARLFFQPWRGGDGLLSGLGFGIGASTGDKQGSGNSFLPRYRTPGQVQFFGYRGTVLADGSHRRWSPQGYWYAGPFGLQAEYVSSKQAIALPDGRRAEPDHRAWQATASWVLTGEDAGFRGVARPEHPFTGDGGGWGAFEVTARVGGLEVDDAVYPLFADPLAAASSARAFGLGLNWYLNSSLKLVATWSRTRFDDGAAGGDREDETLLFTRAQLSF